MKEVSCPSRLVVGLILLIVLIVTSLRMDGAGAEQRFLTTVPTLSVATQGSSAVGAKTFVAIQVDRLPQPVGPEIQFNEGSRALGTFRGGALSADWKEAAHIAVLAATRAIGEDPRTWLVTLKNVSTAAITDGPSASAAIAVAMIAALRGDRLLPGLVMTGAVAPDGRILAVGELPAKLRAAAAGGFSTLLIPPGQTRTREWDLGPLADDLRVTLVEVPTLQEAYERMTGRPL